MLGKGFVLKTLLVLWLVNIALVESAHQKRDVHHRIVIKEPRPIRSHRSKNTKHHSHYPDEKPKKSKKKQHKYVDSFEKSEEKFNYNPEESGFEEFVKKQTKSKRHHTPHQKGSHSSTKRHPKITYHYHESKEPSTYVKNFNENAHQTSTYQESFKENVHHFENVENAKPTQWPGPVGNPTSDEYFLSPPQEKYNENKRKEVPSDEYFLSQPQEKYSEKKRKEAPNNHKLYSSENFEYQQPSKQVVDYYKPPADYPKRYTHNFQYENSESNTYKPFSTSFQQFESNKKSMEASPLIGTMETIKPYTYRVEKKIEPSYKLERFKLQDVASNVKENKSPFKIIVDSYETTKENSEAEDNSKNESEEINKEKKKRPTKSRKYKQKKGAAYGQVHRIKKTIYE